MINASLRRKRALTRAPHHRTAACAPLRAQEVKHVQSGRGKVGARCERGAQRRGQEELTHFSASVHFSLLSSPAPPRATTTTMASYQPSSRDHLNSWEEAMSESRRRRHRRRDRAPQDSPVFFCAGEGDEDPPATASRARR